jgi:hypothetical protein
MFLDEFVTFSWYEANCIPKVEGKEKFRLEVLNEIQRDMEKICEKLRPNYGNRASWHGHTIDGLAFAVGMNKLLPLYRSAVQTCNGNPTGFMSRSRSGRLLFDRNREKSTPIMVSSDSLLLACCSAFYFYEEIVKVFGISSELVLKSLDDIHEALEKHN